MAIELRSGRIPIPSGTGVRAADRTYLVDRFPRACWVAMAGYQARYDNSDHHVKTLQVELSCGMGTGEFGPAVYVTARMHLGDANNDDPFSGWIDFLLFADTDVPRPRDPAVINTGVEKWNL
jgi:hypothetical protein